MKRVCYVIPSLSIGGTERQLLYLMQGLAADHEVTLVCTHHGGALLGNARRLGAYVQVLESWGGWDFRNRPRLRSIFRNHRPDIVHTFLSGFDLAANRAARETGVPVVVSSRRELATWMKWRHRCAQRRANAFVDCIVANSHAVARFAQEQESAEERLFRVIPNGVPLDVFARTSDPRLVRMRHKIPFHTQVVGIVANFSAVKDHALFLATARELSKRRPDVHFLMVGSGPLLKRIERDIRRKGLADRFTRVTALQEIGDVYALMSVSVLCSRAEGFPNAIIESMAAGTPVVAAAVGGIVEQVKDGETGRLVTSRNPADFADAIEWVLNHPQESQAMAHAAKEYVQTELPVARMVDAYRSLYRELLINACRRGG